MRYMIVFVLTLAFSMLTGGSSAQAAPQAASIAGIWVGNGVVQSRSGRKESVQCQIRYSKASGKTYGFSATCASAAGKTQTGRGSMQHLNGNRYSGRLFFAGRVSMTLRGNRQTVTVISSEGTGRLILTRR